MASILQDVSPEKLAQIINKTRVSKHQHTLREFNETGSPAKFVAVAPGAKVTGLESGLSGARRQLTKKGETWAKNIKVSKSEEDGGVYLIRADFVAEAMQGTREAAPGAEQAPREPMVVS